MSDHDLPAPARIEAESSRLGLATSAWELHGALCGWLAGGGASDRGWLAAVFADPGVPAPDSGSPLDLLRTSTAAQLDDRSFEFELLLPDADASLVVSIEDGFSIGFARQHASGERAFRVVLQRRRGDDR